MTKTNSENELIDSRRQSRKQTVWTREKIANLIKLYHQHECLWNYFHEAYKSKERRNKAAQDICNTLRISKLDYGKKIHNLRNQFNSEMKKLERRLEEAGGVSVTDLNAGSRCRWEHFESLMFLRNVIEPRPGGYQSNFPQPKKMRLKYDYLSDEDTEQFVSQTDKSNISNTTIPAEDVTEYHLEEATTEEEEALNEQAGDDYHNYEEDEEIPSTEREEIYDRKYNVSNSTHTSTTTVTATTTAQDVPITTSINQPLQKLSTNKTYFTRIPQKQQSQPQHLQQQHTQILNQQDVIHIDESQHHSLPTGSVIEIPANNATPSGDQNHLISNSTPCKKLQSNVNSSLTVRDQWDAFGELIASEFRHLNSDVSRKKLKRKIMQAMLEIGEEDDELHN